MNRLKTFYVVSAVIAYVLLSMFAMPLFAQTSIQGTSIQIGGSGGAVVAPTATTPLTVTGTNVSIGSPIPTSLGGTGLNAGSATGCPSFSSGTVTINSGNCPSSSGSVLLAPTGNQTVVQPSGTYLNVEALNNVVYMAPTGDVHARANTLFNLYKAQSKGLSIVLTGPAPVTATDMVIPTSNSNAYTFRCEAGASLSYNGTGNAVLIGTDSAVQVQSGISDCPVYFDQTKAIAAFSTCPTTGSASSGGYYGGFIRNSAALPGTFASFAPPISRGLDGCGNAVAFTVDGFTDVFSLDGIRLRPSVGTYASDANAWIISNVNTQNESQHGIYSTGNPQSLSIDGHKCEGSGVPVHGEPTLPSNACFALEGAEGGHYSGWYAEAINGGAQRLLIGNASSGARPPSNFHIGSGISQELPGECDIRVINGDNITIDPFDTSGNAPPVCVKSTMQGAMFIKGSPLGVTYEAGARPAVDTDNIFGRTSTHYGSWSFEGQTSAWTAGSCIELNNAQQFISYSLTLYGSIHAGADDGGSVRGVTLTPAHPTYTWAGHTITLSLSPNQRPCITASDNTQFLGHMMFDVYYGAPSEAMLVNGDVQAPTMHAGGTGAGKAVCTQDGTNCPTSTVVPLNITVPSGTSVAGAGAVGCGSTRFTTLATGLVLNKPLSFAWDGGNDPNVTNIGVSTYVFLDPSNNVNIILQNCSSTAFTLSSGLNIHIYQ